MATSFVIACPECEKQIKVTEQVIGKKIRCKGCDATFVVNKPKRKPDEDPPPAQKAGKPTEQKKPGEVSKSTSIMDDDDDSPGAYVLAANQDHIPRCPFCANELESADVKICHHCGYDMVKRTRHESKAVYEPTGAEKFNWLLPGILSVIGILIIVGLYIFFCVKIRSWTMDTFLYDEEEKKWLVKPGCFMLTVGGMCAYSVYFLGKFAYKRLIINNRPPERKINASGEEA